MDRELIETTFAELASKAIYPGEAFRRMTTPGDAAELMRRLLRAQPPMWSAVLSGWTVFATATAPEHLDVCEEAIEVMPAILQRWVVPLLASVNTPRAAAIFARVLAVVAPLDGDDAWRMIVDAGPLLLHETVLPAVVDVAERIEMMGALGVRLLRALEPAAEPRAILAPARDALARAAGRARAIADEAARQSIKSGADPRFDAGGDHCRPTVDILAELVQLAGAEPVTPDTDDGGDGLLGSLARRMVAVRPLTPVDEAKRIHTDYQIKTFGDWMSELATRVGWPKMNAYWLHLTITRDRFAKPHRESRGREIALDAALVEGWLAADELAKGTELPAQRDPFRRPPKGNRHTTPQEDAFHKRGTRLGDVLLQTEVGAWARETTQRRLAALGDVPEPAATELALTDALATGALVWFAAYGVRPAPLASLIAAAEKAGAFSRPKKPSLAKIKAAHSPVPFAAIRLAKQPPDRPGGSAANPSGAATCPWLAAQDVPRDRETGEPMRFVAQIDLDEAPAAVREAISTPWRFVALFQAANGDGEVVVRDSAPTEGAVDPRLCRIAFGPAKKEPVSAEWARLLSPALFPGPQSLDDTETLLGAWEESSQPKISTSSKVGGTYSPVQHSLRLPDGIASARLVFALDFDDGARLGDAGLVYVIVVELADGRTQVLVHDEHT